MGQRVPGSHPSNRCCRIVSPSVHLLLGWEAQSTQTRPDVLPISS